MGGGGGGGGGEKSLENIHSFSPAPRFYCSIDRRTGEPFVGYDHVPCRFSYKEEFLFPFFFFLTPISEVLVEDFRVYF